MSANDETEPSSTPASAASPTDDHPLFNQAVDN
jgi:hypothetical protein